MDPSVRQLLARSAEVREILQAECARSRDLVNKTRQMIAEVHARMARDDAIVQARVIARAVPL